jgi:uncharacterized cupredoxin-like copper-binding protein
MLQFHPFNKGEITMKRIALLGLIIFTLIGMTACGGTPTSTAEATEAEATEISITGTRVDITLADNTIESTLTDFQVGVPYTFVIVNEGRRAHNFNISTPVSIAGSLQAALSTALLAVDQDELGAGDSVIVDFTFPDSAIGQTLEFSCLIRMHYEDGMLLPITVAG